MRQDAKNDSLSAAGDANEASVDRTDQRVQAALEWYLSEIETRGAVDREQFLEDHSDLADTLRPHLDGIDMMLQVRAPIASDDAGASTSFDSYLHPLATLGDFRLIREIGRGGMGIVFEAEQLSMGRKVALKILPFAAMVDRRAIKRFQNEVRATALLDHPNVVPVYSVGEERSVHFYAMQFIDGSPLSRAVKDLQTAEGTDIEEANHSQDAHGKSSSRSDNQVRDSSSVAEAVGTSTSLATARTLSRQAYFRTVAELVIQAAEGLHHAHEQGIVHRDIKPGNLLLDREGKLWISDFGLARIEVETAGITVTGDMLGTLRYSSPEQAFGDRAITDHRTDIYSLGATLYELLTLRPIFAGHDRKNLLKQIADMDPLAPRRIDSTIPADLETIVLTALSKRPEDRYSTARMLAQDLTNFADHKPLIARPPSVFERANKWLLRHPRLAVAVTAILLLVALTATSGLVWSRYVIGLLETSQATSTAALGREKTAKEDTLNAQRNAEALLYAADVRLAADGLRNANVGSARIRLARHIPVNGAADRRGFAWHYVWNELHPEEMEIQTTNAVREVRYSPDGSLLAAGNDPGSVTLWNSKTGELIRELTLHRDVVRSLAFSADGKTLASASDDGTATLWNVADGKVRLAFAAHSAGVEAVLFGPDDSLITAGGKEVKIWRNGWDRPQATLGPHPESIYGIALSPDGGQLAVASGNDHQKWNGAVTLWDMRDLSEPRVLDDENKCISVAYSHDGRHLTAGTQDGTLIAWTVNDLSDQVVRLTGHASNIYRISFSTDDRLVATASKDMTVRIRDTQTWQTQRVLQSHSGRVYAAAFAPDDHRLVTASSDKTIKFWNLWRSPFALREVRSLPSRYPVISNDRRWAALSFDFFPLQLYSLENDGAKPLVVFPTSQAAWSSTNRLFVASKEGLFTDRENGIRPLIACPSDADVDGDGDADRVAGFGNRGRMIWQERRTDGTFAAPRLYGTEPTSRSNTRIEVHGEDSQDWWVWSNDQIYLNPHRADVQVTVVAGLNDATSVSAADVNDDGLSDLVVATSSDRRLVLLPRQSDGTFPPIHENASISAGLPSVSMISFHDFDGDGQLDVVTASQDSMEVVCLRNEGDGNFELTQRLSTLSRPELLDIRDVNADGWPDIIAAGTEGIVCFYGKGLNFEEEEQKVKTLDTASWIRPLTANVAILDVESGEIVQAFHALEDFVEEVGMSPDGDRLATTGRDHVIRFWNNQGVQLAAIATGDTRVLDLRFTYDGTSLCAAVGDELWVYDAQNYQLRYRCIAHQNAVTSLCISQDNKMIATTSYDLGVRLWSLQNGELLHALVGHTIAPNCVTFSDDNRLLASGDIGVVRIWDVATGQELLNLDDFPYPVKDLAFTSTKSLMAIGSYASHPTSEPTLLGQWTAGKSKSAGASRTQ